MLNDEENQFAAGYSIMGLTMGWLYQDELELAGIEAATGLRPNGAVIIHDVSRKRIRYGMTLPLDLPRVFIVIC